MIPKKPVTNDRQLFLRSDALFTQINRRFNQFKIGHAAFATIWLELRMFVLVLLPGLLLWSLAYQVPLQVHLAVGGDSITHRREDDAPFLRGFNASEPARKGQSDWWNLDAGNSYRWATHAATITFPGTGGGRWHVTLVASSGRPDGTPAISTWTTGPEHSAALSIAPLTRAYRLLATADAAGNVRLQMDTQSYAVPNDPRDLGFVLHDVYLAPLTSGPRLPALAQLGWLATTLALLYPLVRWLGLAPRLTLALALAYVLLTALLLATHRFALTLFTPALTGLALSGWLIACVFRTGYFALPSGLTTRAALRPRHYNNVMALVLLAFTIRLGGMLHPHAIFSDHRLNANNLLELALGAVYFTEGLPAEAGGGQAPYPPGVYLLLAPALLFAPPDIANRVLIVQSGVALLDSLALALIWFLLRQAGLGVRTAFLGAAGYLVPAPLLVSFSIGEYANIGGQALVLPALALLAWNTTRPPAPHSVERMHDPARGYMRLRWWLPLLCIGLLGHLGVTLSFGLLLVSAWGLGSVGLIQQKLTANRGRNYFSVGALMRGGILAVVIVGIVYYSAPTFATFFFERSAGSSGEKTGADTPLLSAVVDLVSNTFAPYHRLPPLLVVSGLVGVGLLWRAWPTRPALQGLAALLLAWWCGTCIALGLPLIMGASQGVRWPHFLYPALCLGAGPGLAALWQRGHAGRVVATLILISTVSYGLRLWIEQLRNYLH